MASCMKLAAKQHGVLEMRQAASAGLSVKVVRRLVNAGHWRRLRPSVYALWTPTDRAERWRQRLMACELWLGDRSAASHRAAAVVWELDGVDSAPIEFSTTGRRRASEVGLTVHRVRSLPRDEVELRGALRVTSVPRTILDLCAVVEPAVVEMALESALRRRLATLGRIAECLAQSSSTRPGRAILRSLLHEIPATATESALEIHVWRLLFEAGLPLPVRQHAVRGLGGKLVARVDFAYPDLRIAIEADGHRFHSSRSDWARDLARQNALTRLGWITYRVTWDNATRHSREVVDDVAELLQRHESVTQN